jgi:LacI family transcriptional regulator
MYKTKRTTIDDVARQCKVSKTAVSLVLNNKTAGVRISPVKAELILKMANKMNYRPFQAAQELSKRRKAKPKALLLSPWLTDSYFMAEVYNALQKVSNRLILERDFFVTGELEKNLEKKHYQIYDAIILMGTSSQDHLFLKELAKNNDVILLNRHVPGCSSYLTDNTASGRLLGEYILKTDSYKKYYMYKSCNSQAMRDREKGLKAVFKKANKELFVINKLKEESVDIRLSEFIDEISGQSSFIFFNHDIYALQGILYFLRKGFDIPGQIGIAGHDNISPIHLLEPKITTVDAKLGTLVSQALKDLIEGNLSKRAIYFKPELIPGTSSIIIKGE